MEAREARALPRQDPGYEIISEVLGTTECDAVTATLDDPRIKRNRAGGGA